jgi:hypothetical protein
MCNKSKYPIQTPSNSDLYNKLILCWDREIPTAVQVQANRPDTLHYDKDVTDTAVSLNHNLPTEHARRLDIEIWLKKSSELWQHKLILLIIWSQQRTRKLGTELTSCAVAVFTIRKMREVIVVILLLILKFVVVWGKE